MDVVNDGKRFDTVRIAVLELVPVDVWFWAAPELVVTEVT